MDLDLAPAARAWLDAVEPRQYDAPAMTVDEAAAPLRTLDVPDLIALGFSFAGPDDDTGERVLLARPAIGLPAGTFTVMLAPGGGHRALLWHAHAGDDLRLWIDEREVPLPRDGRGDPLAESPGGWCDGRLFAIEVVAHDHPGQDWSKVPGRGQIRGLLVVDADASTDRLELPSPDERWTSPYVARDGLRVALYAEAQADQPARAWRL